MKPPPSQRPLWLRWVLAVCAFSLLAAVIVIVVHQINHSGGAALDARAAREANRERKLLIAQDQAPRATALGRPAQPTAALVAAVATDVRGQVRAHQLAGPVGAVHCGPRRARHAGRIPYRCVAAAGPVTYQFLAVVDLRARRLVWCRQDQVQDSGVAVALDPACVS